MTLLSDHGCQQPGKLLRKKDETAEARRRSAEITQLSYTVRAPQKDIVAALPSMPDKARGGKEGVRRVLGE
eukprot:306933-Rhodomonas_salina.1